MNIPLLTVIAVIALGTLYVLIPVAAHAYARFRKRRVVTCPETESFAEIDIDARRAALSSAFGKPRLRINNCSRWPKRQGCVRDCLTAL